LVISKEIFPYEQAIDEFCTSILKNELRQQPILSWLGEGKVTRHRGPVRNIQGANPLDQGHTPISGTAQIDFSIIRNTSILEYVDEMRKMGREIAKKQSTSFFSSLDEMFDHSSSSASNDTSADSEEENS
jgi:hypothetical protein